jgi:uncharacterized membrane protein YfcA
MLQLLFLFAAGFFGGVINSIAGDGSFITFPSLPCCWPASSTTFMEAVPQL